MKKKLLAILMFIFAAALGLAVFSACGSSANIKGTYYLYENGEYDKSSWIELKSDTWTTSEGDGGDYTVSDTNIYLYVDLLGYKEIFSSGTVKDGVLTLETAGVTKTFCKNGSKPSSSGNNNNGDSSGLTKYTVTYNANGGTFSGESTFEQQVAAGSTLTAPTSPTRTDYTFAGWAKNKSGSEMWNFSEDKVTGDVTLYAVWTQKSATILSVDEASINGDSILMIVSPTTTSVRLSDKVVCSEDSYWQLYYDALGQMEIPTKIAASLGGELLNGDNIFYIVVTSSDRTQVNTYTLRIHRSYTVNVTYMANGTVYATREILTGTTLTNSYDISCSVTGYTFNGWNTSAVFGEVVYAPVQFTAKLTANKYKLTFDSAGGSEVSEKEVTFDASYTTTVPKRTGYSFLGWYVGSTQLTDAKGVPSTVWKIDNNTKATAHWQANNYTLTLNVNNSAAGTVTGGGEYAYDSKVTIHAETKRGYTWLGWYSNNEFVSLSFDYTFTMGLGATYEGRWMKCPIAIKSSDVTVGTVSGLPDTTVVGQKITLEAAINLLGYKYLGWFANDTQLTEELTYSFTLDENISTTTYIAKYEVDEAMQNFKFTSTASTCTIMGLKDKSVTEIIVPDYVTNIDYGAFYSCNNLVSITIPFVGGGTGSVSANHFGYIFLASTYDNNLRYVPSSLKTVIITGGTKIGGYAFYECTSLTSITIPDSVTSIGERTFYKCTSLTSITIPNSVTSIGRYAFYGCTGLKAVYITDIAGWCNISFSGDESNPLGYAHNLYLNEKLVTELEIPNNVTSIGWYAFHGCRNLTSITIPDSVTSIGGYAFYWCSSLTNITIPDSVTSIGGYAFYGCSSLTNITIPDSVTSIGGYAFYGCTGLESVTIGNGVTSIGDCTLGRCSSLEEIIVEKDNTVYHSAGNCLIKTSTGTLIAGCKNSIIPSDGSVTSIGGYAFNECSNLTNITIPDSVTSIGDYAFCHSSGRTSLTSVVIGKSVTSIGSHAFNNCLKLESVHYKGTKTEWEQISISSYNSSLTSATRYYYSDEAPSEKQWNESPNWWHYDENDKIVIWTKEN